VCKSCDSVRATLPTKCVGELAWGEYAYAQVNEEQHLILVQMRLIKGCKVVSAPENPKAKPKVWVSIRMPGL
jgi:hypothetical protein